MKKWLIVLLSLFLVACSTEKVEEVEKENKAMPMTVDLFASNYAELTKNRHGLLQIEGMYIDESTVTFGERDSNLWGTQNEDGYLETLHFKSDKPNARQFEVIYLALGMSKNADELKEISNNIKEWTTKDMPDGGYYETITNNRIDISVSFDNTLGYTIYAKADD